MMLVKRMYYLGIVLFILVACTPATLSQPEAPTIQPTATSVKVPASVTPKPTPAPLLPTMTPSPFPLSQPGPYFAGTRKYTLIDPTREERDIDLTVWYPALQETDANGRTIWRKANPDMSGAPYPLVLTGIDSGSSIFRNHMSTHGFVEVHIRTPIDNYEVWNEQMLEFPRDFLFALQTIGSEGLAGLEGVIDADRTGVVGHSWEGMVSLAVSGVRIDPEYYLAFCANVEERAPTVSEWYKHFVCDLAENWENFAAVMGASATTSEDGLWQALTDPRIRAVMPSSPEGGWLYGERGLAAADRPMLIIAPTQDEFTPYEVEMTFIYEHLVNTERTMISYVERKHMMVFDANVAAQIRHFATAFFGYHLQEKQAYADYFSESFVTQFEGLAWGVYEGR